MLKKRLKKSEVRWNQEFSRNGAKAHEKNVTSPRTWNHWNFHRVPLGIWDRSSWHYCTHGGCMFWQWGKEGSQKSGSLGDFARRLNFKLKQRLILRRRSTRNTMEYNWSHCFSVKWEYHSSCVFSFSLFTSLCSLTFRILSAFKTTFSVSDSLCHSSFYDSLGSLPLFLLSLPLSLPSSHLPSLPPLLTSCVCGGCLCVSSVHDLYYQHLCRFALL